MHIRQLSSLTLSFFLSLHAAASSIEEERLWQQLEQTPRNGAIWAELALLYCQQNRMLPAQRMAEYVLTQPNTPPEVISLMQVIHSGKCATNKPASTESQLEVQLHMGYDTNANLGAAGDQVVLTINGSPTIMQLTETQLAKPDFFKQVGVQNYYPLSNRSSILMSASYRSYQQLSELDQSFLALQAISNQHSIKTQLGINQFWMAGRSLWQQLALTAHAPLTNSLESEVRIALQFYPEQPNYHAHVFQLGLRHQLVMDKQQSHIRYGLQLDKPNDGQRPGGQKQGGYLGIEFQRLLTHKTKIQLNAYWLHLVDSKPYSSLLADQTREQNLIQLGASMSYATTSTSQCGISLFSQKNETNLPLFGYEQSVQYLWCSLGF